MGISLPAEMLYQGGNPSEVRKVFEVIESQEQFKEASRVLLIALAVSIFGTKSTRTGRLAKANNFGEAASRLAAASLDALKGFKDKGAFTVNVLGAAVPEVCMFVAAGGSSGCGGQGSHLPTRLPRPMSHFRVTRFSPALIGCRLRGTDLLRHGNWKLEKNMLISGGYQSWICFFGVLFLLIVPW